MSSNCCRNSVTLFPLKYGAPGVPGYGIGDRKRRPGDLIVIWVGGRGRVEAEDEASGIGVSDRVGTVKDDPDVASDILSSDWY